MKPAGFTYHRPRSLDEATSFLRAEGGSARVLAGGQSLLPLLNRREVRPTALVDLGGLTELRHLTHDGGSLRVGALITHAEIERTTDPLVLEDFGVLARTAPLIGHQPIRTRGTFCGSIAHADPVAQWCLLAVLADAEVVLRGPAGTRSVVAEEFFLGRHRTAAAPDEIVVETRFPAPLPTAAVTQFAVQHGDLPVVVAGAVVELDADGTVTAARLALGGVADRPVRAREAERELLGGTPDSASDAIRQALADLTPPDDGRGDPHYRRALAVTLLGRAIRASVRQGAKR